MVDHDIDAEVFHRRVEILFDGLGDAVNLVDKQDVAFAQVGEQASEVSGLIDHGAGGDADLFAHLMPQDQGEGGLTEPRRAAEQNVVEWVATIAGCADHDFEALNGFVLPSEVVERQGAEHRLLRADRISECLFDEFGASGRIFWSEMHGRRVAIGLRLAHHGIGVSQPIRLEGARIGCDLD